MAQSNDGGLIMTRMRFRSGSRLKAATPILCVALAICYELFGEPVSYMPIVIGLAMALWVDLRN